MVAASLAGRVASIWLGILGGGVLLFWLLLYLWSRRFEAVVGSGGVLAHSRSCSLPP